VSGRVIVIVKCILLMGEEGSPGLCLPEVRCGRRIHVGFGQGQVETSLHFFSSVLL